MNDAIACTEQAALTRSSSTFLTPCWAAWVSGSGFKSTWTAQYLRVLHFRCRNCPSLTYGISRNMQCKWISQNPASFHLRHSPVKRCTHHPPSSHLCRLQIYGTRGKNDAVSVIPFLFPAPVATCGICLTLPVRSRKDGRAWDMPRQPTKMSFCFKHAWRRMRVWFSSPLWQHETGVTSLQQGEWDKNEPGRQGLPAWLIYCIKI